MTLEQLKKVMDQFCPPFLPRDYVKTVWHSNPETGKKTLGIIIGQRDIEVDENGTVIATGTRI